LFYLPYRTVIPADKKQAKVLPIFLTIGDGTCIRVGPFSSCNEDIFSWLGIKTIVCPQTNYVKDEHAGSKSAYRGELVLIQTSDGDFHSHLKALHGRSAENHLFSQDTSDSFKFFPKLKTGTPGPY
jgi:hypothetical protein